MVFSARFMDLWAVLGLQIPLFVGFAFGPVSKHKSFLQDSLGGNSKTVMIGRSIFFSKTYVLVLVFEALKSCFATLFMQHALALLI